MFLKIIACEIALREISFLAAQSPHLVDLEFLPQGYHDNPVYGRNCLQERVDAVPAGKYDAVLLGYGLCGNIISGLRAGATQMVVPRAHDCITFFLGSKERYKAQIEARPAAYYYSCGWLECMARRGEKALPQSAHYLPSSPGMSSQSRDTYQQWVEKYGEEDAKYLLQAIAEWTGNYTHGILIDYDFTRVLKLREQVESICAKRQWTYEELTGDLRLLKMWVDGAWPEGDFLTVPPGAQIEPSYNEAIIRIACAT